MKRGNTEGGGGRFWGRGRFSKRSASPPDPLSRRVAAVRVVFSSIQYTAVSWSVVSCCLVVVTAADRAAATYATWGTNPSAPHVRGGSVSRRGLTQAARNRTRLSGGTKPAEAAQLKRQRSSGGAEEGLSREAASEPSLREGARGRGFSQRSRLPRIPPYFLTLPPTSPARWRRCAYFS